MNRGCLLYVFFPNCGKKIFQQASFNPLNSLFVSKIIGIKLKVSLDSSVFFATICFPAMSKPARYSISALSRKTGLSVHTLRFYEKEGIIRHVERTASGRRVYGEDSIGCLIGALCMKQARLTLAQIKEFFDLTVRGSESLPHRLEMLLDARRNLDELKANISKSIKLVDFFIDGANAALSAMANGENPDEAFPLLTREGIATIPTMMTDEGKLEPDMPRILEDSEL